MAAKKKAARRNAAKSALTRAAPKAKAKPRAKVAAPKAAPRKPLAKPARSKAARPKLAPKPAPKAAKPAARAAKPKSTVRKPVPAPKAAARPAPRPAPKPVRPAALPKRAAPAPAPQAAAPAPKPSDGKIVAPAARARKPAAQDAAPATFERTWPTGVRIRGPITPAYAEILTEEAVEFITALERLFGPERRRLLGLRRERQDRLDNGEKPDFLPETAHVRNADWTVAPLPDDLLDRRVEITGPVDRKMVINALNSGASVFMADFEDATTPSWTNLIEGQINLRDAIRRRIEFVDSHGREYRLKDRTAVLFVRPRGWHLPEKHVLVDGKPMSGSLFDFGLYFFHNAKALLDHGTGPYFYLPKLESHLEARLWNAVFNWAQDKLGIRRGTIKATVLIETILATFEADEILYELREHSAGLNCGRWDYIFSFIKKFAQDPACILPDRAQVTMTTPFMRNYSQFVIRTCHRRNVHAMGGMAAQIPIKGDPAANEAALAKVRADKQREASDGHDGTWVAHPGLVPIARAAFDEHMKGPNQIARKRQDVDVSAADLLAVPGGEITEQGLRTNINVAIGYVEAWLRGLGCVPLYNLMEDAATAEISRAQVWQWVRHGISLADGRTVTPELCRQVIEEELQRYETLVGPERFQNGRFGQAADLVRELIESGPFPEFLTLPAYDWLMAHEGM